MSHAIVVVQASELREQLTRELEALSVSASVAESIEDALSFARAHPADLLFTDLCLPHGVAFELLELARDQSGLTCVLLGDPEVLEAAEDLFRPGTARFLPTPLDRAGLEEVLRNLPNPPKEDSDSEDETECIGSDGLGPIVGRSPVMKGLFRRLVRIAPTSASVLVTGESGTGKELVAQTLHELSERSGGPFIAVNCGAISPNLTESELFGHERGSFTGATRTHRGFFERADGGTLFLDEITEMPADLQIKLLRVLETSRVTRIGGETKLKVDVRIVAATNRPPDEAIEEGRLREDLYYRLKVLHLHVPSLRERRDDVLLLAEHFLEMAIEREGRRKHMPTSFTEALLSSPWPGNVRELKNAVYSAYLLSEGDELSTGALPPEVLSGEEAVVGDGMSVRVPVGSSIEEAEKRLILTTLAHMDGNKTRTAEVLGVSVKTLYNRLHAYGAMPDTDPSSDEASSA